MKCPLLKVVLTAALVCLPLPPLSAHGDKGDASSKEVLSPLEDMYAEFREIGMTTGTEAFPTRREIWLVDKERKNEKLLYSYDRWASILFSPDQKYIAINDHCLSTDAIVLLYTHVSGLEYKPMNVDVTNNAWKFFCKRYGCENDDDTSPFDHNYADDVLWSADSSSILMSLKGHLDSKNNLSEWYCVYDVEHNKTTLDLNVLNRGSVELERGKR